MRENIYAHVNFQEVIAWSEAENGVLGAVAFLVTLKLLRLIRFNEHVAVLSRTLKVSTKLLWSFMAVFLVIFMAFMHFGILIFGTGSEKYSSLLKAIYFQLELCLGRVKARPIKELSDANATFGRIFASTLLLSLTILFMNFFIAAINDALLEARDSVIPNELCDLVDEHSVESDGRGKVFFDAISKRLKEKTSNDNLSVEGNIGGKVITVSNKKQTIDFDFISKAIANSRQKANKELTPQKLDLFRRKSFFDTVSDSISRSRLLQTVKKYQKLRKKEKYLFQRLDNIVQGDYDEEETFSLLCHQI